MRHYLGTTVCALQPMKVCVLMILYGSAFLHAPPTRWASACLLRCVLGCAAWRTGRSGHCARAEERRQQPAVRHEVGLGVSYLT